jgi:protein-tyrosine phosphatase
MKRVLFLCTGNYYRSRFSELFFNWHAQQRDLGWRADSRGLALAPWNIGPIASDTVERLRHLGIRVRARPRFPMIAQQKDFEAAAHIVALKRTEHRPMIEARFSSWLDRVEFWEVHDLDCAGADEALPQIECRVMELIGRLTDGSDANEKRDA